MSEISRTALFGKLNELCYQSIESATIFCKIRGNPYVEISHWIHQILQLADSDLHRIVRHFQVDVAKLARDLTASRSFRRDETQAGSSPKSPDLLKPNRRRRSRRFRIGIPYQLARLFHQRRPEAVNAHSQLVLYAGCIESRRLLWNFSHD